jgi:hypothetical protein
MKLKKYENDTSKKKKYEKEEHDKEGNQPRISMVCGRDL